MIKKNNCKYDDANQKNAGIKKREKHQQINFVDSAQRKSSFTSNLRKLEKTVQSPRPHDSRNVGSKCHHGKVICGCCRRCYVFHPGRFCNTDEKKIVEEPPMLQQAALAATATERRRCQRKGTIPDTSTGAV